MPMKSKKKKIKFLTCKEYAKRYAPHCIDESCYGEVYGCPDDLEIGYMSDCYYRNRSTDEAVKENFCHCTDCWNRLVKKRNGKYIARIERVE